MVKAWQSIISQAFGYTRFTSINMLTILPEEVLSKSQMVLGTDIKLFSAVPNAAVTSNSGDDLPPKWRPIHVLFKRT